MIIEKKSINEIKKPMNKDYLEVDNMEGMPALVDSTIAMSFLLNAKSGIRNCAVALTEIADTEARAEVTNMLNKAIALHVEITQLMTKKGWFHPYEPDKQFELDKISSDTALQIAGLNLFPGDTSRLGTFATPNY